MRLKLGLRRASGGPVDIVITADATATVGDVAAAIAHNDPAASALPVSTGGLTLAVAPPTSNEPVVLPADALIGDAPIGSGFNAAVVADTARARSSASTAPAALLEVRSGPEAGRRVELRPGHTIVGRGGPGVDLVLADPLVSKRHARIEVGAGGIEVVDLNSANGVLVDGGQVQRVRTVPGQVIVLGDTEVVLAPLDSERPADDPVLERGGALMFNRSPRVEVRYPGTRYPQPLGAERGEPAAVPVAHDRVAHPHGRRDLRDHAATARAADRVHVAAHDARQLHRAEDPAGQEAPAGDRDLRVAAGGPRGDARRADLRRAGTAPRRGAGRGRGLRAGDAARAAAVDATPGALELPRAPARGRPCREPQLDPGVVGGRDRDRPVPPAGGEAPQQVRAGRRGAHRRAAAELGGARHRGTASTSPPTSCAASGCSCSDSTPRTSSSPPRSWIPRGRGSSTG